MAFDALIPLAVVFTAINREILIIMVKSRGHPAIYTMAGQAVGRKSCCDVVRVVCRVVLRQVATNTSVWGIGVIAVVTSCTVVGDRRMRPAQYPIIVVNRERCRIPVRIGRVAHRTVIRNAQSHVAGVDTAVVIRLMTPGAGIGRVGIIAVMTRIAIVGNRDMRPRKRIECIVVKCRRNPGVFRMAVGTRRGELSSGVVGIKGRIVVRLMASGTGIGRIVVIAVVAGRTIVGDRCMRAVQSIIVVVDRERCRIPVGVGRMAHVAIRRQAKGDVAWVRTAVVIGLMAAHTGIRGIGIIPVVAGFTIVGNWDMGTRERINRAVVKRSRHPGIFTVTAFTGRRKLCGSVVRIGCRIVIAQVAACTSIWRIRIIAVVTGRTIVRNWNVRTVQNIIIVVNRERCGIPSRSRRMAHLTIRRQP